MKKADFFEKLENDFVQCTLCPHNCRIAPKKFGLCGVRQNQQGVLVTHVYERAIATHVDPIEKKPLFHVYPGSKSFSVATVGCNFTCTFCQNHEISQMPLTGRIQGYPLSANEVVKAAREQGCRTIACTYTEPTIYYEYAYDIAVIAKKHDIDVVFVSNGYINPKPLKKIAPFLTAINVDLKGWDEQFYRQVCGGDLKSVKSSLKLIKSLGIFLEVTTLVVTGYVDNTDTLKSIARFIVEELGSDTPWHVSRFHPSYQYRNSQPTPLSILQHAREIGYEQGLRYVYSGNVFGDEGESTFCYSCGAKLIARRGYEIISNAVKNNACPYCGAEIDGVGMS